MSVYLYTPPQWLNVGTIEGSLRYSVPTSTCVYRLNGAWFNVAIPGMDNPVVANCDVWVDAANSANTLRLFFTKPMVVPGALHDELAALQPADPSWSAGSLTLL